jgi:hypothetical protein
MQILFVTANVVRHQIISAVQVNDAKSQFRVMLTVCASPDVPFPNATVMVIVKTNLLIPPVQLD